MSARLPRHARERKVLTHALEIAAESSWARPSEYAAQARLPSDLQRAWADFLDRWSWKYFCTFTTRDALAPEAIDKRYRRLVSEVNRDLYGRRWAKRGLGIRWVRAWEPQRRGVLHLHALWGETKGLRVSTCRIRWEQLCCRPGETYNPKKLAGIARFEFIENSDAVRRYVSKYVAKGGELDLGGAPFRFMGDQPSGSPAPIRRRGLADTPLGRDTIARLKHEMSPGEWEELLEACKRGEFNSTLIAHVRNAFGGGRARVPGVDAGDGNTSPGMGPPLFGVRPGLRS